MTELTTVIPVFNGERFLPATLACIAAQTRPSDRVVILDNGSTDRTPEIVANLPGLKCEFRRNESNLGVLGNLNRCLELASETRFLHLLMADDLVKPEFYRKLLAAMEGLKGGGLGYSFNETISQSGDLLSCNQQDPPGTPRQVPLNEFLGRQASLATVLLPGVVLKTDFRPAPCRFQNMPQVADGLFLAEWAALTGEVIEVREFLCQYRVHPFNASSRHMYDLQFFVVNEWQLTRQVLDWIKEPWLTHQLRRLRLHCLLASRTQVKMDMMRRLNPHFAAEIARKQRELAGRPTAAIGWGAVRARDLLRRLMGKPTKATELISTVTVSP